MHLIMRYLIRNGFQNNKGKVFRIVAGLVYKLVPSQNMRYKIWKFAEKEMSKYSWMNVRM